MLTTEEMAARVRNREQANEPADAHIDAGDLEAEIIDMAARIAAREAAATLTAAGGDSWKWQLRDNKGRWITMGSKVSWMSSGRKRNGTVTDSTREGWAQVLDDDSGVEIEIPQNRLTVTSAPGDAEKKEIAARESKAKIPEKSIKSSQPEPDTLPTDTDTDTDTEASSDGGMPQAQQKALSVDKWEAPTKTGDVEKDTFKQKAWDSGIGDLRGPDGKVRPGRPDGAGTAEDPIYVGRDLDRARKLLLEEKHIRLESQQDLIRLLDMDMANSIKASGKTINMCLVTVPGTNLFCSEHKGVTRVNMPQLGGEDKETGIGKNVQPWAEEMLEGMDLINPVEDADPHTLAASQNELVTKQIIGMKNSAVEWYLLTAQADALYKDGKDKEADAIIADRDKRAANEKDYSVMNPKDLTAPILVTHDGYIIDGHHRWASTILLNEELATMGVDPIPMQVRRVKMEIGESLVAVNAFADAAGIARKSGGGAAGETPKVLQKEVSPQIAAWIEQNMSTVLEQLNARPPGMEDAPLKDVWEYNVNKKRASNAKAAKKKAALAASLSPGDVLMMDDDSVRMVLKVIAETADSIAVLQADPDTDQFDLTVLASAAPILLL